MTVSERPAVRGWLVAPSVAIALFAVPIPSWAVDEFYSRGLYPWIQSALTAASNLVPGAVMDFLLVVATGLVLYRSARLILAARRRGIADVAAEGLKRLGNK